MISSIRENDTDLSDRMSGLKFKHDHYESHITVDHDKQKRNNTLLPHWLRLPESTAVLLYVYLSGK